MTQVGFDQNGQRVPAADTKVEVIKPTVAIPPGLPPGAVPIGKPKQAPSTPPRTPTKYEVRQDSSFTIKFGVAFEEEGRAVVIDVNNVQFTEGAEAHWVKFRMWTYGEELDWKNKCTEYDQNKRTHWLNQDRLNELKMRNLMLEWSFAEASTDFKLFHINHYMVDESYKMVNLLFPSVLRHIIDRMNNVLEYNG